MVTCGAAVSPLLERHGVGLVFGIPGNHTLELYRGLEFSGIRHITTRHEQGAAFMAAGYARVSGKPGICFLISGPGLLNAATAIAQARADSVPLLIITAVAARAAHGRRLGLLHELPDQQASAQSFCTESLNLECAEDLPMLLDYAFHAFQTRRPGPIHLQIPLDLMTTPMDAALITPPIAPVNQLRTAAIDNAAIHCLEQASAPILLLGGGAVAAGRDAVVELAQRLDAPVLQTTNAKGLMPIDHPLFVGGSPSLPAVAAALQAADVVLAIGTEFGETDFDLLMGPPLVLRGDLVRIDIDPEQITANQMPNHRMLGAAQSMVPTLLRVLRTRTASQGATRAADIRTGIRRDPHCHPEMARFFELLQKAAPDLVLVGDSTRPTYYASWQYEPTAPNHYFHSVSGFGTLGYAIPAAMGAKLASEAPVIGLIGDGGAQFSLPELATAMDNQIAVTFIIWCNRGYEEIEHSLRARGVSDSTTRITAPDFALIGQAYGMTVYQPRTWEALAEALRLALAEGVANLLLVRQDDFITQPSGQWYR